MSNEKENEAQGVYDELLKNGEAILSANTRDELAELVNNIPAESRYAVGAVGQTRDLGKYTIQVNLI